MTSMTVFSLGGDGLPTISDPRYQYFNSTTLKEILDLLFILSRLTHHEGHSHHLTFTGLGPGKPETL